MPSRSSDAVRPASVWFEPALSELMIATLVASKCSLATPAIAAATVALPPVMNSALAV